MADCTKEAAALGQCKTELACLTAVKGAAQLAFDAACAALDECLKGPGPCDDEKALKGKTQTALTAACAAVAAKAAECEILADELEKCLENR